MACISPPELDDQTLLVYIDGKAPPDVAAHVERCSHCRERAHRLARQQDRLTATLYRIECPSPSELGEFHLGILPAAQMEVVRHHLDECPHCYREIAQLEGYLAELEPAPEPTLLERAADRIRVLVARLVSGGSGCGLPGQRVPAPAYAGLRGDGSKAPLVYRADDVQVCVEVEADAERPSRSTVLGLVIGLEETSGFEAYLYQAAQCVMTTSVDELGNFVLPDLPPGEYELILSSPDLEIHIQHIQVGDIEGGRREGEDR